LLGGGWGNEWYFGYAHAHSDLTLQDFRSRDQWWDFCRYALELFEQIEAPLNKMTNDNSLSSATDDFCFFAIDDLYLVYLKNGGTTTLDLSGATGQFRVYWYDPRNGGELQDGSVTRVTAGSPADLGTPPNAASEDWLIVVQRPPQVAYIYGDVSANGKIPSGLDAPFHQMLITDTGPRGLSQFKSLVENQGYEITALYDQDTILSSAFLRQFDVLIFGLHQKIWPEPEKAALDAWLRAGGGMLIYSDSASGGLWSVVGAQNTVGQTVVNNLTSSYGLEVTVDQANGVKAYRAGPGAAHPIVLDRPVLEGEGVSPVAYETDGPVVPLIPYTNDPDFTVAGVASIPHQQNLSLSNPAFAALALRPVEMGNIIALFDRQPLWNDGEGSDIDNQDNREILRRVIRFLAGDPVTAENRAPLVSAGSNQVIDMPAPASLVGNVSYPFQIELRK